jgi:hypothetical protein
MDARLKGGMESTRVGSPNKIRKLYTLNQIGSNVDFRCHNNDIDAVNRGLLERVFFVESPQGFVITPQPLRNVFEDRLMQFRRELLNRLPPTTAWTRQQYVDSHCGRKKLLYQIAADSLQEKEVRRSDAFLDTFVKIEKIDFTAKPNPAPRVIQPRKPRYNVEVGRWLKPIEHNIYSQIDYIFGNKTVVKGLNASQRGKLVAGRWNEFRNPVAVGLDAKRFDQHVSKQALEWEHSIYNKHFKSQELKRLLKWQVENVGYANCKDGRTKYFVEGKRCSGDVNTALGNVILMCAMMWTYLRGKNCPFAFIDDGDDCILICERSDLHLFDDLQPWFLEMGFQMARDEPVYELEKISFCQCHPVFVNGEYRMVRDPRICLAKDLCYTVPLKDEQEWSERRNAISQCGIALAGDIPVLGSYYDCLGRNTSAGASLEVCGLSLLARGMTAKRAPPSDETRFSFYLAFGISPDRQVAIESVYDQLTLSYNEPIPVRSFLPLDEVRYFDK